MHVARWVLATLVTAGMVLAAVSVRVHRSEGGTFVPPSSGRLLPFEPALTGTPRRIGMLAGADLDRIVDVTTAGDTVFVLAGDAWRLVAGTRVRGPFGARPDGAPESIGRGIRIVAADSGVYVLDLQRREVSRWTRTGTLIERLPLGSPSQPLVPQDLAVDAHGTVHVVAQEVQRTAARWVVLRLARERSPEVVLRASTDASLFTQPRIATQGNRLVLIDPVTHARTTLPGARTSPRPDAPAWATPDSVREEYAARMQRIRVPVGPHVALPATMPSLQALASTRDGRLLTGSNPLGDALHVEVFAADGTGLGRISAEPVPAPVFLTPGGIVRVTEEPRTIVFTLVPLTH